MAGRKSIGEATAKSFSKVKALLKERGITVEAVDGPSHDDKDLRFLQELQQIESALESSAPAENREWGIQNATFDTGNPSASNLNISADTMDSGISKGKKGL
jgi:hypothetical protein